MPSVAKLCPPGSTTAAGPSKSLVDHDHHLASLTLPVQQQSSSGTEEGAINEATTTGKPGTMSANVQKSTTGKSTSSSGVNRDGNYMTIKDIPVDLQHLDVDAKR